jgi:hypothetical protein
MIYFHVLRTNYTFEIQNVPFVQVGGIQECISWLTPAPNSVYPSRQLAEGLARLLVGEGKLTNVGWMPRHVEWSDAITTSSIRSTQRMYIRSNTDKNVPYVFP